MRPGFGYVEGVIASFVVPARTTLPKMKGVTPPPRAPTRQPSSWPPRLHVPGSRVSTVAAGGALSTCVSRTEVIAAKALTGACGRGKRRSWRILCVVKFTRYFTLRMRDRPEVRMEWCRRVLNRPEHVQQQEDGKYQMWGYIDEVDKYLRIISLEDRETLDNAFFDRSYRKNR